METLLLRAEAVVVITESVQYLSNCGKRIRFLNGKADFYIVIDYRGRHLKGFPICNALKSLYSKNFCFNERMYFLTLQKSLKYKNIFIITLLMF